MKLFFHEWKDFCLTLCGGSAFWLASTAFGVTTNAAADQHLAPAARAESVAADCFGCPYGECPWNGSAWESASAPADAPPTPQVVGLPFDPETGKVFGYDQSADAWRSEAVAETPAEDTPAEYNYGYGADYENYEYGEYGPEYHYSPEAEVATEEATEEDAGYDYDDAYSYEYGYDYDYEQQYNAQEPAETEVVDELPSEPAERELEVGADDWRDAYIRAYGDEGFSQDLPAIDLSLLVERLPVVDPLALGDRCRDWMIDRTSNLIAEIRESRVVVEVRNRAESLLAAASQDDESIDYDYAYDEYESSEYDYDTYEDYGYGEYSEEYGYSDYGYEAAPSEPAPADIASENRDAILNVACALNMAGQALQDLSGRLVELAERHPASHYEARKGQ
jgi:hypothetical protein